MGDLLVRRLTHPEDGSTTWFVGRPNVHVVEQPSALDRLLTELGVSRSQLEFDPPHLRADFERDFGPCPPCVPQPAPGGTAQTAAAQDEPRSQPAATRAMTPWRNLSQAWLRRWTVQVDQDARVGAPPA